MKVHVRIVRMVLLLSVIVFLLSWSPISVLLEDAGFSLDESQTFDTSSTLGIQKTAAIAGQEYVEHVPIQIFSDADFKALGFPGEGTEGNPYVIEGLNITEFGTSLILIEETTAYFRIQHNFLDGVDRNHIGITLREVQHGTIADNIITNCSVGIHLNLSRQNTLTHNTVSNGGEVGIDLRNYSWYNTLTHNTISNGGEAGIYLDYGSNLNTILANTMTNNGLFIEFHQTAVTDNMVNGRPLVYWEDVSGGTVPPGAGQVILFDCDGVEVTGQDLSQASVGMLAIGCLNLEIHSNTFANNSIAGIDLSRDKNTLTHNTVSNCGEAGIDLFGDLNTLTENTVSNCGEAGIDLIGELNTLTENTVSNCGEAGIDLIGDLNTLTKNTISNCEEAGIGILGKQNTLLSNTLVNNGLVIKGEYTWDFFGSLETSINQAKVTGNVVNGRPLVFWQHVQGGTVPLGAGQVVLINCTGVTVTGQDLTRASIGVLALESSPLEIYYNTVSQNRIAGISIKYASDSIIHDNTISHNGDGIVLYTFSNSIVTHNLITNNHRGIVFKKPSYEWAGSKNNKIDENIFFQNQNYGVYFAQDTYQNLVQENDFLGNNLGGSSQASSSSSNDFSHNFWADQAKVDQNGDGVADTPYPIIAGNQDSSPLMVLTNPLLASQLPHSLLAPIMTYPNGGETLQGTIAPHWVPAFDTRGHSVSYDVSYSADNGRTWVPLASGLSHTTYEWETTTVADGSLYRIRVEATCVEGFTSEDSSDVPFTIRNIAHSLSAPTVLTPAGGETLQGTVMLDWASTSDTWGHPVSYTIFYSMDDGRTWTILAAGLESPGYEWETTTVPDGPSYRIKVVATCAEGLTAEDSSETAFAIQNQASITTTVEAFSHPGGSVVILLATLLLSILPMLRIKRTFGD